VQEALTDLAYAKAINEEMQALQKNSTLELVSLAVIDEKHMQIYAKPCRNREDQQFQQEK